MLSCEGCGFALRYCPCCGKPLASSATSSGGGSRLLPTRHSGGTVCSVSQQKHHHHQGEELTHPTPAAGGGSSSSSTCWSDGLPPRAVSAFELFTHELRRCNGGGAGAGEAAIPALSGRGAAQAWLTAPDSTRERCEERARLWNAAVQPSSLAGSEPAGSTGETDAPAAAASTSTAAAAAVEHAAASQSRTDAGAAAAEASQVSDGVSVPVPAKPAPRPKRRATMPLRKSSYYLFRTKNKKIFSSLAEMNRVWGLMSEEDKAPYDAEAALLRTQQFMSQGSPSREEAATDERSRGGGGGVSGEPL